MILRAVKISIGVVLFLAAAVWSVYSVSYLSRWPPAARAQAWLDRGAVWVDQQIPRKNKTGVWLPGKVRISEINIQGNRQSLFFVNARVIGWNPLTGELSVQPFGSRYLLTAAVRRGGLETDPPGTAVFLPWTRSIFLEGLPVGQGSSFLVPDFKEDKAGDIARKTTWSLVFCAGDAVSLGWKSDRPLSEAAGVFGDLRKNISVQAEVIFRYLRQTACE